MMLVFRKLLQHVDMIMEKSLDALGRLLCVDHLSGIEQIDHFPLDALIGHVNQDGADQQDKHHQ